MPFKSKAQERYLFAKEPEVAKEFANKTPDLKKLPQKAPSALAQTMAQGPGLIKR